MLSYYVTISKGAGLFAPTKNEAENLMAFGRKQERVIRSYTESQKPEHLAGTIRFSPNGAIPMTDNEVDCAVAIGDDRHRERLFDLDGHRS